MENKYEFTKKGQIIAGTIITLVIYVMYVLLTESPQEQSTSSNINKTPQNQSETKIVSTDTKMESQKNTNAVSQKNMNSNKKSPSTPPKDKVKSQVPKNEKVVKYKEPSDKSRFVRKHHDMETVKNTNYSKMVPFKSAESPQEQWVINYIKKYDKDLPRTLIGDYGDRGYYVNYLGKDKKGRYIIPGINPNGQWSTVLYSKTNKKSGLVKLELGHNWEYWQRTGYKVNAFYASNKTISLRNEEGKNIVSSMYPVNQSMSKGPAYRFK